MIEYTLVIVLLIGQPSVMTQIPHFKSEQACEVAGQKYMKNIANAYPFSIENKTGKYVCLAND